MQLNEAKFSVYGKCGYVLQPLEFRDSTFHPSKKNSNNHPLFIKIQVYFLLNFLTKAFDHKIYCSTILVGLL